MEDATVREDGLNGTVAVLFVDTINCRVTTAVPDSGASAAVTDVVVGLMDDDDLASWTILTICVRSASLGDGVKLSGSVSSVRMRNESAGIGVVAKGNGWFSVAPLCWRANEIASLSCWRVIRDGAGSEGDGSS